MEHKQYILEWKSVNKSVELVADLIGKMIWSTSMEVEPKLSELYAQPFLSGEFVADITSVLGNDNEFGMDSVNVKYILYLSDSYEDFYRINRHNSSYDRDTNTLTIVCALIKGKIHPEFMSDIYHEIEHCFQYSKGINPNRVLYDLATSKIGSENIVEDVMCRLIYYTFPHEVDAFANQFYAFLRANKPNEDFKYLLYNATEYLNYFNNLRKYRGFVKTDKDSVKSVLEYLNLDIEQFNKRIHFGGKRLRGKLNSVYDRYHFERRRNEISLSPTSMSVSNGLLMEYRKRYKKIEYSNEFG